MKWEAQSLRGIIPAELSKPLLNFILPKIGIKIRYFKKKFVFGPDLIRRKMPILQALEKVKILTLKRFCF